jgi:pimeloyl-ACP methyl ester carboxylesterase
MDEGSGPHTLLFIHGLANYAAGWKRNIEVLRKKYRCVSLDLPGNGLSEHLPSYSIKAFAECIIDFIGRLGLGDVCVIGHSMGGQIAIKVALDAPQATERLVLCAPAGFEGFTEMDRMFYQGSMQYMSWISNDAYNLEQTLHNSFYRYPSGADKMVKDLLALMQRQPVAKYREMVDQCVMAMLREPVLRELAIVRQKTLVLFGENDALIPNRILHPVSTWQVGKAGTDIMQQAQLHMIPDCGHFLQWEKAEVMNKLVDEWLTTTS